MDAIDAEIKQGQAWQSCNARGRAFDSVSRRATGGKFLVLPIPIPGLLLAEIQCEQHRFLYSRKSLGPDRLTKLERSVGIRDGGWNPAR